MALHNGTTGKTRLDVESASRHDVLRSKQVIIGCGGGFRHECANRYSPVAQWMSEVDLASQDESQQYGNLDEAAAIARMPRKCLVVWLGDHRQTPQTQHKSQVARRFRQKLFRPPVALRGKTDKVQPNTLHTVVARYLTGTPLSPAYPIARMLEESICSIGGFLPIFWSAPFDRIHATIDLGLMVEWIPDQLPLSAGENGCLAVLHNRNDMVGALNGSEWVSNSDGRIISRGVTLCAGMTAHHVLLAQNKVGFLIGGRSNRFLQLDESEKNAQREEAFARASVALTRAQRFCFVMCLLDMKGFIGAAAVVGCLQHGAGICEQRVKGDPYMLH